MFIVIILIISMTSFNYKSEIVESEQEELYRYFILNKYKKINEVNINNTHELTSNEYTYQVKAVRDFMIEHQCFYETGNKEEIIKSFNKLLDKPTGHKIKDLQLELIKIMAQYKQGHIITYNTSNDKYLPILIGNFKEKYYVIASEKKYSDLIGSEILKINNIPMEGIKDKVAKYVSAENNSFKNYKITKYMNYYNILEKEKILKLGENKITVNNGETVVYKLPIKNIKNAGIKEIIMESGNNLIFPNDSGKYFDDFEKIQSLNRLNYEDRPFYTEEKGNNLLIRYNSCAENGEYKIDEFTNEVFKKLDSHEYDNIVFDLRLNNGGDSRLLIPIILKVKSYDNKFKRAKVKLLIGPSTYSSAGDNSLHIIRLIDNVELIGEDGGFPINTGGGNINTFYLKNTYIISTYCKTLFFSDYTYSDIYNHNYKNYDFTENMLTPDFHAEQSYADYLIGNDPAMNYALRDEGDSSLFNKIKSIFN